MTPLSEILVPPLINLSLAAKTQAEGVTEVLSKLNGDPRVQDWTALVQAVTQRNAPALVCEGCGICIAHGRTNAVNSLVMAAGRSPRGLSSPEVREKVRLVFVAGIPSAFDSEYLRVVGAIARLCRNNSLLEGLLSAPDTAAFAAILAAGEARL